MKNVIDKARAAANEAGLSEDRSPGLQNAG